MENTKFMLAKKAKLQGLVFGKELMFFRTCLFEHTKNRQILKPVSPDNFMDPISFN